MSPSDASAGNPSALGTLLATSPDPLTEIRLLDHRFRTVETGVGKLSATLEGGLYKVKFSSADQSRTKIVHVQAGRAVEIDSGNLAFASAAPYAMTRTTHEYHLEPAIRISQRVHVEAGHGARVLLFVRDDSDVPMPIASSTCRLLSEAEGVIADLGDGERDDDFGWAGCVVEVSPGRYQLWVAESEEKSVLLSIPVAAGWETHVFLTTGRSDATPQGAGVRYPRVALASVMMTPYGIGFDPSRRSDRAAEQARQSLTDGRHVLDWGSILALEPLARENPLLFVYALTSALQRSGSPPPSTVIRALDSLGEVVPGLTDLSMLRVLSTPSRQSDLASAQGSPPFGVPLLWDLFAGLESYVDRSEPWFGDVAGAKIVQRGPFATKLEVASRSHQPPGFRHKARESFAKAARKRQPTKPRDDVAALLRIDEERRAELFRERADAALDGAETFVLAASIGWTSTDEGDLLDDALRERVSEILRGSEYGEQTVATAARNLRARLADREDGGEEERARDNESTTM